MRLTIWLFASLGVLATLLVIAGCGGGSTAPAASVVAVTINQASPVSVTVNGTKQFTATVTGTSNTAVTWSVQEGATGGSFSQTTNGLYTAPAAAGTYHVVATSAADATKSATVTVNVTAANVNTAPTAGFTITPSSGPTSTSFAVDASGSTDAQDATSALQVRWDWENDGVWDTAFSATKTANHSYAAAGTYTIKLEVRDTGSLSSTLTHTVTVTAAAGATFTVTLDGTVDTSSGSTKASTFTTAALLNTSGTSVKTGTVSGTTATFDMSGLSAGTYFVQVNGLTNDLVPARIDNTAVNGTAFVGTRLRDVLIGAKATPTYRIKTFSLGQGNPAVVKYSNGATATPTRYAYFIVLVNSSSPKSEVRVLGTAALLTSDASGHHSYGNWVLGASNHGVSYGGNDNNCNGCHNSLDTHAASYASINDGNGWCFKCHNGKTGPGSGMVDPTQ